MKLAHYDITETNHAGIDQRANAAFYAPDKLPTKTHKRRKGNRRKQNLISAGHHGRVASS